MIYILLYLLSIDFHLNSYILPRVSRSQLLSTNKLISQFLVELWETNGVFWVINLNFNIKI